MFASKESVYFSVMAEDNGNRKSAYVGDIVPLDRNVLNCMVGLFLQTLKDASINAQATNDKYSQVIGNLLTKTHDSIFKCEVVADAIRDKLWDDNDDDTCECHVVLPPDMTEAQRKILKAHNDALHGQKRGLGDNTSSPNPKKAQKGDEREKKD